MVWKIFQQSTLSLKTINVNDIQTYFGDPTFDSVKTKNTEAVANGTGFCRVGIENFTL